jgi:hypothetical protein
MLWIFLFQVEEVVIRRVWLKMSGTSIDHKKVCGCAVITTKYVTIYQNKWPQTKTN